MMRLAIVGTCCAALMPAGATAARAQGAEAEPPPPGLMIAPLPPPPPVPEVPEPDLAGPFAPGLRPRPLEPGNWITTDDYPLTAMREERQGRSGVRFHITASGRIDLCEVIQTSGHADLDAATCATLIRRARLQPATDAEGKPIASIMTMRITWALPEDN